MPTLPLLRQPLYYACAYRTHTNTAVMVVPTEPTDMLPLCLYTTTHT